MKNLKRCIVIGFAWGIPFLIHADVSIHEVAWMGNAENANAEWIELYNDGSNVEVTGWTLVATDGQPSITLDGSITGGGYYVLERTSDETVPDVNAGCVYTGAMGNTGEVLELRDVGGVLVDRVDGSGDWVIGGDNTTKLTLQRHADGWVTAQPTPGRANAERDDDAYAAESATADLSVRAESAETHTIGEKSKDTNTEKRTKEVKTIVPLTPSLSLELGSDITVAAGVPLVLSADVRKEGGKQFELDTLMWNFGDGATGGGRDAKHTYLYPGEYVVTVKGERGLFKPPITDEDQIIVHVVPLLIHVSHADKDSIEITNDSEYDVDLSLFILGAGNEFFRIPQGTILLKRARIRFAAIVTKVHVTNPHTVAIFTPGKVLASVYGDVDSHDALVLESGVVDQGTSTLDSTPLILEDEDPLFVEEDMYVEELSQEVTSTPVASVAYAQQEEEESPSRAWWLLALTALIGTTITVVLLVRRERAEIIEGFEIESDE